MRKDIYNKEKKALLNGENFATTALAKIELRVMDYITTAVTQYHDDGNVDHAKAGGVLLEGFNPKWTRTFFKAVRQCRALHTDFKIVVTPDAIAFTYTPIPKDRRPDTLPELQAVIDSMLSEFLSSKRSREGKSDAEKEESAIKGLITSMGKAGRFDEVLKRLSIEELQVMSAKLIEVVNSRVVTTVTPAPAPEPVVEPVADERNIGTDAVPATDEQIAELVAAMEA